MGLGPVFMLRLCQNRQRYLCSVPQSTNAAQDPAGGWKTGHPQGIIPLHGTIKEKRGVLLHAQQIYHTMYCQWLSTVFP